MLRSFFSVLSPSSRSTEQTQVFSAVGSLLLGAFFVLLASAFIRKEPCASNWPGPSDRLFRVGHWIDKPGNERLPVDKTAGRLAPAVLDQLPEIEATGRMMLWPEAVPLSNWNGSVSCKRWAFADPAIPALFEAEWLQGDAATALSAPGQVVLTESMAKKLFGTTNAVGKTMLGLGGKTYTVSGVIRNPVPQSAVQYDLLASWSSTTENSGLHDFRFMNNWTSHAVETYVLLHRAEEAAEVERKIATGLHKATAQAGAYDFFLEPVAEPQNKSGAVGRTDGTKFSENYFAPHPGVSLLSAGMPF